MFESKKHKLLKTEQSIKVNGFMAKSMDVESFTFRMVLSLKDIGETTVQMAVEE